MKSKLLSLILVASACGLWPATAADSPDLIRGQALAEVLRTQQPGGPSSSRGTLRIRQANGRRVSIPVEVHVTVTQDSWRTLYRAHFPDGRRESLIITRFLDAPPEFHLIRTSADGKTAETKPARPEELYRPYATTDFWLADLGMVFYHWPEQRWKGRETRRTRVCNILESFNPKPARGEYRRVLTWVDDETGGIIRAEAYDASNKLIKEFSPGSFARVGSRYELREMEIRNAQNDTRTTLEFSIDDPKRLGIEPLPEK